MYVIFLQIDKNTKFDKLEELQQKCDKTTPNNEEGSSFQDIDFDVEEIKKQSQESHMKLGKKIKVKLIIAEICKNDAQKALRKMLSPVMTKLDLQQQFGMFHSALVVGPWYLEWNNSSMKNQEQIFTIFQVCAFQENAIHRLLFWHVIWTLVANW